MQQALVNITHSVSAAHGVTFNKAGNVGFYRISRQHGGSKLDVGAIPSGKKAVLVITAGAERDFLKLKLHARNRLSTVPKHVAHFLDELILREGRILAALEHVLLHDVHDLAALADQAQAAILYAVVACAAGAKRQPLILIQIHVISSHSATHVLLIGFINRAGTRL